MPLPLVDWKGLVSSVGRSLRAPEACTEADNILFDAPGCARKRRGFQRMRAGTDLNSNESFYGLFYARALGTSIIAHTGPGNTGGSAQADTIQYGSGAGLLSSVALDAGVTCVTFPDVSNVSAIGRTQHFFASNSSHYFTSNAGVVRVDTDSSSVPNGGRFAGQPNGMAPNLYEMGTYNVLTGGAGGFLADGSAAAYRVTWHRRLTNGTELGGAPTGRTTVRNIAGTSGYAAATAQNTTLRILIPPAWGTSTGAATTDWYYKLWRTYSFTAAQGDPDDEMFQVAQANLTAGDIAAGYATASDSTPDAFLLGSTKLHTNAIAFPPGEANTLQGQLNSDSPPPSAQCAAFWADVAWYGAGLENKSTLWQMLALPADGDTITINGLVMTFRNAPAAPNDVQRVAGLASLTLNIEATCRNLVDRYNIDNLGTTRPLLYYTSVGTAMPGQFLIAARLPNQPGTLTVSTSVSANWRQLTVAGLNNLNDYSNNVLAYSKAGRPDAVPPQNRLTVGSGDARVLRMMPMQTSMVVFTTTGAFRVTGTSWADFNVQPFDSTYRLISANLVAAVDDRIFAWCYEGIIEFSEGGARPVSLAIDPTLTEIRRVASTSHLATAGFAVGYPSQHRVQFFYPPNSTADEYRCRQWLSYDTRTECWSTGSFASSSYGVGAAVVRNPGTADDVLILGSFNIAGNGCYLLSERAAYNNTTDFQDDGLPNLSVADSSVSSTMYWKFLSASPDVQAHWQQQVLQLEGNEFTWLTPDATATVMTVAYDTDLVTTPVTTTLPAITTFQRVIRLETPAEFRRGNQLGFRVSNTGTTFFGLCALSVSNGDVSRWPK